MTREVAIILSVAFLVGTGFIGLQFNRMASSIEYSTAQLKKFEPIVDVVSNAAAQEAAALGTLLQQRGR